MAPKQPLRIETARLSLVNADRTLARLVGADDHAGLGAALGAAVAPGWPPEIMRDALAFFGAWHDREPSLGAWGMWLFVLRAPAPGPGSPGAPTLIGAGGFKGPPDAEGRCETGYSVLAKFQRRGLATEATRALAAWAFADPRVHTVTAETLPGHESSLGVMRKCAMVHMGEGAQEAGVTTERWGVTRESFERASAGWNR